jgi:hypothetical protein
VKAQDRGESGSRIKKARARFGLWCHCDDDDDDDDTISQTAQVRLNEINVRMG